MSNDEIVKSTENVLKKLGIQRHVYSGYDYIIQGILLIHKSDHHGTYLMKWLYVDIALEFGVNDSSVERNIRTVINAIWNYSDRNYLKEIFAEADKHKVTNKEFFDILYRYIMNEYSQNTDIQNEPVIFICPKTNEKCELLCDICTKILEKYGL